jgi:hypothetical protein
MPRCRRSSAGRRTRACTVGRRLGGRNPIRIAGQRSIRAIRLARAGRQCGRALGGRLRGERKGLGSLGARFGAIAGLAVAGLAAAGLVDAGRGGVAALGGIGGGTIAQAAGFHRIGQSGI